MSHIALIGLSYKTAPIAIREQLSCTVADIPAAALTVASRFEGLREIVLLSTCNRVELYAVFADAGDHAGGMASLLSEITGVETAVFSLNAYHLSNDAVANHLFHVAAGLESLVLGEPQILGQVTRAYTAAIEGKTIGCTLDALFRAAIRVGKRARAETAVSCNPMSTSSLAIAHAEKRLDNLRDKHILIVGLGEMGRLALKRLEARGAHTITLINRTDAAPPPSPPSVRSPIARQPNCNKPSPPPMWSSARPVARTSSSQGRWLRARWPIGQNR